VLDTKCSFYTEGRLSRSGPVPGLAGYANPPTIDLLKNITRGTRTASTGLLPIPMLGYNVMWLPDVLVAPRACAARW